MALAAMVVALVAAVAAAADDDGGGPNQQDPVAQNIQISVMLVFTVVRS